MNKRHTAAFGILICMMALSGCPKKTTANRTPEPPSIQLTAPGLVSPADASAFHTYPRALHLQWDPVAGASSYRVEVDCYGCCVEHQFCQDVNQKFRTDTTAATTYDLNFVGDQPGRWRVFAVAADSSVGPPSEWRTFTFGRVIDGKIVPPATPIANTSDVQRCPTPVSYPQLPHGAKPPHAIYDPNPSYSAEASKDKVNGNVVLSMIITSEGGVRDVCVLRSLRADLDERAVGAVRTWRFEPAKQNGAPFDFHVTVEVSFRSY